MPLRVLRDVWIQGNACYPWNDEHQRDQMGDEEKHSGGVADAAITYSNEASSKRCISRWPLLRVRGYSRDRDEQGMAGTPFDITAVC